MAINAEEYEYTRLINQLEETSKSYMENYKKIENMISSDVGSALFSGPLAQDFLKKYEEKKPILDKVYDITQKLSQRTTTNKNLLIRSVEDAQSALK